MKSNKILYIVDEIEEQEKELMEVRQPGRPSLQNRRLNNSRIKEGIWIYYPWRGILVHSLVKNEFKKLRLSRNADVITGLEQKKLKKLKIAVAGLNVGNPGAVCLALEGIGSLYKLADVDPLSVSNLNRFRAGITDLGVNKSVLTARQIMEIDPFSQIQVFSDGVQRGKIDDFLSRPRVDVLIEEMDDLELKILIREEARHLGVPVLMVTGNADEVIVDLERFDLNQNMPLLNGLLDKSIIRKIKEGNWTREEKIRLSRDFIVKKYLHPRLWQSFSLVGKRLAGIPQLAETSFLRGAVICNFVRRMFLSPNKLKSGRYLVKIR